MVLDLVGGSTTERSFQVLKPGGHLVTVLMDTSLLATAKAQGKTAHVYVVEPSGAEMERIAGYIESGQLTGRIDRT